MRIFSCLQSLSVPFDMYIDKGRVQWESESQMVHYRLCV